MTTKTYNEYFGKRHVSLKEYWEFSKQFHEENKLWKNNIVARNYGYLDELEVNWGIGKCLEGTIMAAMLNGSTFINITCTAKEWGRHQLTCWAIKNNIKFLAEKLDTVALNQTADQIEYYWIQLSWEHFN